MPMPKVIIQSPPLIPAKFGILSAVQVMDETDPHASGGVQWEPDYCGPAENDLALCYTVSFTTHINVNDEALSAQFTGGGNPQGVCAVSPVTIDWGDGDTTDVDFNDINGVSHTYDAPGDYTITVSSTDDCQVSGSLEITIADPPGDPDPHVESMSVAYIPVGIDQDDRGGWAEAEPFLLYHASTCKLPGITQAERIAYAERALRAGEGRAIEEAVSDIFSSEDTEADITVLNGGAAAHWTVALARLEKYAFLNYGGRAVIYMNREVASMLLTDDALVVSGDKLFTKLGNIVAAGTGANGFFPGFPFSSDFDEGTFMFATGNSIVTRQPIDTSPTTISDSTYDPPNVVYTNDYTVLAQRGASFGWECFIAAHLVLPVEDGSLVGGDGIDGGTP